MKHIPFLELKKLNSVYEQEISDVFQRVLKSGWYLLGNEKEEFEIDLARYLGAKNVIGTGNGLDALVMILRGYILLGKLHKGDEVLVPANTFIASVQAIMQNDLKPVFVEPSPNTFNLCIEDLQKKINSKTKALIMVHLYGSVNNVDVVKQIVVNNDLLLIEDNAQAIGAEWNGVKTGNLGDAAAFSFYPGKNLGALSDAGAVSTNDTQLAEVIRALSNYGSFEKYIHDYVGFNSRLDELQAGILNVKLKDLDRVNEVRQNIAKSYCVNIINPLLQLPNYPNSPEEHVWHLFVIRTKKRSELMQYLKEKGIGTMIHYPIPPHKQKALKEYNSLVLPVAEKLHNEVVSIPLHQCLSLDEQEYIIEQLNAFKA